MRAVSVIADEELRRSEGRFHAAAIPNSVSIDATVVRFVAVRGRVRRVQLEATYSSRRLWLRLLANAAGTFLAVLVGSLWFLALTPAVFGLRPVVVSSGSMAPALRTADAVVTRPPPESLPVGAVIDFRSDDRRLIHRIIEVTDDGYRTKGDANRAPDRTLVKPENVAGVGVMVVPLLGCL